MNAIRWTVRRAASHVFINKDHLMKKMRIGTHNGTFHCDEVLACFFLRQLPEYKDAEIVRSRDASVLAGCDVVVDVGGKFDPSHHLYDHHQRPLQEDEEEVTFLMNAIRWTVRRAASHVFINKDHLMKKMRIGTHNGTFHCDEVLACFFLRQLPEYKDAEIVRSRDASVLAGCDVVVDVGGKFDPSHHLYDHHQRSFAESFHSLCSEKPWVTKLSSAGLVYFHFGRQVLAQLTQMKQDDTRLEILYDKMYENFVEEVDAVDNGICQCDGEARYSITTTLSARVGHLNPHWNSKHQDTEEGFHKALALVGAEFQDRLDYYMNAWLPAREVVQQAVQTRYEVALVFVNSRLHHPLVRWTNSRWRLCSVDPSGEIVLLAQGGCPWKEHLFTLEKELMVNVPIKFVLYTDQNGHWRVQCVPAGLNTFQNRLSILEEWRGVRDEALSELSGIPDCIFVHAGGFIGGNKTKEGALEMAKRTLQTAPKPLHDN